MRSITLFKSMMIFLLFTVLAPVSFANSEDPSFDCKKATTDVEKMICDDEKLKNWDRMLSKAYQKAKSKLKDTQLKQLISSQTKWAQNRNFCTSLEFLRSDQKIPCLGNTYSNRTLYLERIAALAQFNEKEPGPIQPIDCELLSNLSSNLIDKKDQNAKKIFPLLLAEMKSCIDKIALEQPKQIFYASNLLKLAAAANADCTQLLAEFDPIEMDYLKKSGNESSSTEWDQLTRFETMGRYLSSSANCSKNEESFKKDVEKKFREIANAKIHNLEKLRQLYGDEETEKNFESELGQVKKFLQTEPLEKSALSVRHFASVWTKDFELLNAAPKECPKVAGYCKVLEIGQKKSKTKLFVHLQFDHRDPKNSGSFKIVRIQELSKAGVPKELVLSEPIEVEAMDSELWLEARDCESRAEIFLTIGSLSAHGRYWVAYRLEPKSNSLIEAAGVECEE